MSVVACLQLLTKRGAQREADAVSKTKRRLIIAFGIFWVFGSSTHILAQSPDGFEKPAEKPRHVLIIELLTDPQGADFGTYFKEIMPKVKAGWHIPEPERMKRGTVAIRLNVRRDGKVSKLRVVEKSNDAVLDDAAWEAIKAWPALPALPSNFSGRYLTLRFRFFYNPDKSDLPPGN